MNKDNKLVLFFVITLAWTWGFGFLPLILGITGTGLGTFLFYFGGGAPSVTALFIVFLSYTKEQKRDYFKRCFSFRYMGIKWPLITIGYFALISVIGLFIGVKCLGYEMPGMDYIKAVLSNPLYIPLILLLSLISGPLNEEFGWRGFALDRLIKKFGFTVGSLILGFIWAIWHAAWYFTPGQAQYSLLKSSVFDALMYIPAVMLLSVVVSFVYIKTKRSILAGALVHMFGNLLNSQLLSPYSTEISMCIRYTKMAFCFIVMLYCIFSKNFQKEWKEQLGDIELAVDYTKEA